MAEIMTLYNVGPFFAVTGILSLGFGIPILRFLDNAPAMHAHRESNVDGLRGYLALAVFIYHSAIYYNYLTEGTWDKPQHLFYGPLGGVGVAFFFMITGFLFWGKLLKAKGEPAWRELYIGRVFRIGPMYIFTVLVMMLIIFQRSNFEIRQPRADLLDVSIKWLALGLNADSPIFNGFPWTPFILLGVTWSIKVRVVVLFFTDRYLSLRASQHAAKLRNSRARSQYRAAPQLRQCVGGPPSVLFYWYARRDANRRRHTAALQRSSRITNRDSLPHSLFCFLPHSRRLTANNSAWSQFLSNMRQSQSVWDS